MKNVNLRSRTLISKGLDLEGLFSLAVGAWCMQGGAWRGKMRTLSLAIVWREEATSDWMMRVPQTFAPADGDLCVVLFRNGFCQK